MIQPSKTQGQVSVGISSWPSFMPSTRSNKKAVWNNWYHQNSSMWKPKTVGVLWFPQLKPKQWIDHELTMQGNCRLNEFWKTWGVTCSSFLLHPWLVQVIFTWSYWVHPFLAAATVSWWSWLLCLFPTVHGYCKSLDLILWVASYPSCCNSQLSELAEDFPTMKRLWFACLSAGALGTISISCFNLQSLSLQCSRKASYKAHALLPSHITQLDFKSKPASKTALTGQYRQGSRNTNPFPFGSLHSKPWLSSCNLSCCSNSLPIMNS